MKTSLLFLILMSAGAALAQKMPDTTPETGDKAQKMRDEKIKGDATTGGAIQTGKVFFIEPHDGATVPKKFKVKMGVEGFKIRPAGEAPNEMTSGHHHLLIDQGAMDPGSPIANDDKHLHFGKGQTETEVTLPPGKHTLTLQFADGAHRSFGQKMSQTITVNVK